MVRASILFVLLLLLGCSSAPDPIIGNWVATDVREKGDSMRLEPTEVRFEFLDNGRYRYVSTLRYQEAGTYEVRQDFLVAKDTMHPQNPERVVSIELLKADSLVLNMKEAGVERTVVFIKQ